MNKLCGDRLEMIMISSRGMKVWPAGNPETFVADHLRCRFMCKGGKPIAHQEIADLLGRISVAGFDFVQVMNLFQFDGQPGFSLGQGQ
jgi:isocitrate dehydrogenase